MRCKWDPCFFWQSWGYILSLAMGNERSPQNNLNVTLTIYRVRMTMNHGQDLRPFAAVNLTQIRDLMWQLIWLQCLRGFNLAHYYFIAEQNRETAINCGSRTRLCWQSKLATREGELLLFLSSFTSFFPGENMKIYNIIHHYILVNHMQNNWKHFQISQISGLTYKWQDPQQSWSEVVMHSKYIRFQMVLMLWCSECTKVF